MPDTQKAGLERHKIGYVSLRPYIDVRLLLRCGTMLYLVGLGLCDATDITVKGLEIVRRASRVYLEAYTSILTVGKEALVRTGSAC